MCVIALAYYIIYTFVRLSQASLVFNCFFTLLLSHLARGRREERADFRLSCPLRSLVDEIHVSRSVGAANNIFRRQHSPYFLFDLYLLLLLLLFFLSSKRRSWRLPTPRLITPLCTNCQGVPSLAESDAAGTTHLLFSLHLTITWSTLSPYSLFFMSHEDKVPLSSQHNKPRSHGDTAGKPSLKTGYLYHHPRPPLHSSQT